MAFYQKKLMALAKTQLLGSSFCHFSMNYVGVLRSSCSNFQDQRILPSKILDGGDEDSYG